MSPFFCIPPTHPWQAIACAAGTTSKAPPQQPVALPILPPPPPPGVAAEMAEMSSLAECIQTLHDLEVEKVCLKLELAQEGCGRYVDYPKWEYLKTLDKLIHGHERDTRLQERLKVLSKEQRDKLDQFSRSLHFHTDLDTWWDDI